MKTIVGIGACGVGLMIWVASVLAALVIDQPTIPSLGVILGGALLVSGIAVMCMRNHSSRIRFSAPRA